MLYGNKKPWLIDNLLDTAVEAINFLVADENQSQLLDIIKYLMEINQVNKKNPFYIECTSIESSANLLKILNESLEKISEQKFSLESEKITKKIKILSFYYNHFKVCNYGTIFSIDHHFLSTVLSKLTRFDQEHPLQLEDLARLNTHILEGLQNFIQINVDLFKRKTEEEQVMAGLVGKKIQAAETFKYEAPKPYKHEPKKLLFSLKYIKIQKELNHCFLKHKKAAETTKLTEEFENEALEMKVKQHRNMIIIDNYHSEDFQEAKNNLHRFFAAKCEAQHTIAKEEIEPKLTK